MSHVKLIEVELYFRAYEEYDNGPVFLRVEDIIKIDLSPSEYAPPNGNLNLAMSIGTIFGDEDEHTDVDDMCSEIVSALKYQIESMFLYTFFDNGNYKVKEDYKRSKLAGGTVCITFEFTSGGIPLNALR